MDLYQLLHYFRRKRRKDISSGSLLWKSVWRLKNIVTEEAGLKLCRGQRTRPSTTHLPSHFDFDLNLLIQASPRNSVGYSDYDPWTHWVNILFQPTKMYQFKNKTDLPFAMETEEKENWSSVFSHTKHITHGEKTAICQAASFSHRLGSMGQILHVFASQEEKNAWFGALVKELSHFMCFRWQSNEWRFRQQKSAEIYPGVSGRAFLSKIAQKSHFISKYSKC